MLLFYFILPSILNYSVLFSWVANDMPSLVGNLTGAQWAEALPQGITVYARHLPRQPNVLPTLGGEI